MASPWKFLARLTSRRRGSKEQPDGITGDVKSEETANPEPIELATGNAPDAHDRLGKETPRAADQSDAVILVPQHSAEPNNIPGPSLSPAADFTTPPTRGTLTTLPFKKRRSVKQKRRQETNTIKSVEVFTQLPTSVPTFFEEMQNLDEEVGLLRDQLCRKLQLQNAQLRMMLERFER